LRNGVPAPGERETKPRSPAMVRKVTTSLSSLIANALERGKVGHNVVRSMATNRRRKVEKRQKQKLVVGRDIPTPDEIDALLQSTTDARWRAFFLTAIRCGLRASELRGLRWQDIDFKKSELHVVQRADAHNTIGNPKSADSQRSVPIPPKTLAALREWKTQCPKLDGRQHFVFPNGMGHVENHSNLIDRGLIPSWVRAGATVPVLDGVGKPTLDDAGRPVVTAKYTGLHSLRHYFASWCLARPPVGIGLNLKEVSSRIGHSSIQITADTYAHLLPRDDTAELAAAEGKFG
jgi:integrase